MMNLLKMDSEVRLRRPQFLQSLNDGWAKKSYDRQGAALKRLMRAHQ